MRPTSCRSACGVTKRFQRGDAARGCSASDRPCCATHQASGTRPLLNAVDAVLSIDPRIGTLREELERTLAFDNLTEEIEQAVRAAIDRLPQDLVTRIRILTEGWPLVQDREKSRLPDRPRPDAVAAEIMNSPKRDQVLGLLFGPSGQEYGRPLHGTRSTRGRGRRLARGSHGGSAQWRNLGRSTVFGDREGRGLRTIANVSRENCCRVPRG